LIENLKHLPLVSLTAFASFPWIRWSLKFSDKLGIFVLIYLKYGSGIVSARYKSQKIPTKAALNGLYSVYFQFLEPVCTVLVYTVYTLVAALGTF
jgi:hypothetical protein